MSELKKFIQLYNGGTAVKDIAIEVGLEYHQARILASILRKLGEPIKKRPGGSR